MIGHRVRLSREACALTQVQLAEAIGLTQAALSQIESGKTAEPSEATLEAIAEATGYPLSFFNGGDLPDLPTGNFRKLARGTVKVRKQIRAHTRHIVELVQRAEAELTLPPLCIDVVTELTEKSRIEMVTQRVRQALGIGPADPIPNLTRSIERAGVIVARLPWEMEDHDSFSAWPDYGLPGGSRPLIILTEGASGDRDRFNVAHELAHLVLHRVRRVGADQAEIEAHRFAGALLLPRTAARECLQRPVYLDDLMRVKAAYGISMAAAAKRAADLDIIDRKELGAIYRQLNRRNWRRKEPVEVPREMPLLLPEILRKLAGEGPLMEQAERVGLPLFMFSGLGGADGRVAAQRGARNEHPGAP